MGLGSEARAFAVLVLAGIALGCTTNSGRMLDDAGAHVFLSEGNYRVVKEHVVGTSSGLFLLMILPVSSPSYSEAKQEMYKALGEPVKGRSIALTNQTEDVSEFNVLLFSIRSITLSADFIEFDEPIAAKALPPP